MQKTWSINVPAATFQVAFEAIEYIGPQPSFEAEAEVIGFGSVIACDSDGDGTPRL